MSLTREENLQINRLKNKDLSGETGRNELIRLLDDQLVDTLDLSLHLQRAYWESSECHMEHKKEIRALFDGFGRELLGFVGRLAELIRALGGHPLDRVSIGMHSRLRDYPKDAMTARDHIYALLSSYSQYERITEASIRVMHDWEHHATVVLLQEARRCAERDLWFLEAYLENLVIGSSAEPLPTWRSASSMERRLHSREMWP